MPRKDLPQLQYDVPSDFDPKLFQKQWDSIIALSQEKMLLERQMFLLNQAIEAAWKVLPVSIKARDWIPCRRCSEKTQDRFGGTAMCAKHVAKGDAGLRAVLEDALYGPDN
jgi:hypothetical protein